MVERRQVKKISDLLFMIVPGFCPADVSAACDACTFSNVEFKAGTRDRKALVKIGYVSCLYAEERLKNPCAPC